MPSKSHRDFRFSIRESLVAIALLAVGFTWLPLLIFIVPLLAVAVLSRMGFGHVAPFFVATVLSLVFGVLVSQLYWGYPFVPPPALPELAEISSLERLSEVSGLNAEQEVQPTITARSDVSGLRCDWIESSDRMLDEFRSRNLRVQSSEPIATELLESMWRVAETRGLLVQGQPGYLDTKTLFGHVAIGYLGDDSKIAIASLLGMEESNDHYPYYEFVFSLDRNEPQLINSQRFFGDISGIEGFNWFSFAVMSFIVMAPLVIAIEIAWAICKRNKPVANDVG
jgi:hypothetical protein